jgi:hypothetical protein
MGTRTYKYGSRGSRNGQRRKEVGKKKTTKTNKREREREGRKRFIRSLGG